jgi:hypothetical protein
MLDQALIFNVVQNHKIFNLSYVWIIGIDCPSTINMSDYSSNVTVFQVYISTLYMKLGNLRHKNWFGNTGVLCHMTKYEEGMLFCRNSKPIFNQGDRECLVATFFGQKVCQYDEIKTKSI